MSACPHQPLPSLPHLPCSNAISERWSVEAPATLMFDQPTIAALATWLADQLAASSGATGSSHDAAWTGGDALALPADAQPASLTAVAGVSCRFPSTLGSGAGLAGFWQQAAAGADVQTVVPLCKWDAGAPCCVQPRCWVMGQLLPLLLSLPEMPRITRQPPTPPPTQTRCTIQT